MGQLSIFAFCFQVRGLVFLQKTMMRDESNVLQCPKRAFSDVLKGVVLIIFLGGKSPHPQVSLTGAKTFVHDRSFCIDHLQRKGTKFIAIEKRSEQLWFISHVLLGSSKPAHPARIFSSTALARSAWVVKMDEFCCYVIIKWPLVRFMTVSS